jgi:hypothetical protein
VAVSDENVERVRRGVADVHECWAMFDEYVVWDMRGFPLLDLDHVYVGRDAVIQASRHYWGTWTDYSLRPRRSSTRGRVSWSCCGSECEAREAALRSIAALPRRGRSSGPAHSLGAFPRQWRSARSRGTARVAPRASAAFAASRVGDGADRGTAGPASSCRRGCGPRSRCRVRNRLGPNPTSGCRVRRRS